MQAKRGFTLVEILIVVVILGILAAIVIPQFTQASTEAKVSSSLSTLQSLRSQVELYKIQHNDFCPTLDAFDEAMTMCSNSNTTAATDYVARTAANTTTHPYGPYMQAIPLNPWNNSRSLAASDGDGVGWVYDEVTGDIFIAVSCISADTETTATLTNAGAVYTAAPVADK